MRAIEDPIRDLVDAPEPGEDWTDAIRGDQEWEVCFALPIILRCRSRKRLVKLLMSVGMGRNDACGIAEWMRCHGVKYQDAWLTCLFARAA